MKLSEFKSILEGLEQLNFRLPNGEYIPTHFHITEVGFCTKHYIDCGGIVRDKNTVQIQIWYANDLQHRLKPQKLFNIIRLSEQKLNGFDAEIEIEYQNETIGKYTLAFLENTLQLQNTYTTCLAEDACGISVNDMSKQSVSCCTSNGKCC